MTHRDIAIAVVAGLGGLIIASMIWVEVIRIAIKPIAADVHRLAKDVRKALDLLLGPDKSDRPA